MSLPNRTISTRNEMPLKLEAVSADRSRPRNIGVGCQSWFPIEAHEAGIMQPLSGRATELYCVAGPPAGITMVWLRAGDTYPMTILATSFIEGTSTTKVFPPTGSAR